MLQATDLAETWLAYVDGLNCKQARMKGFACSMKCVTKPHLGLPQILVQASCSAPGPAPPVAALHTLILAPQAS